MYKEPNGLQKVLDYLLENYAGMWRVVRYALEFDRKILLISIIFLFYCLLTLFFPIEVKVIL